MRLVWLCAWLLLTAGCTTPAPVDPGPGASEDAIVFRSTRIDQDGDGLSDALNLTLLRAPAPIPRDELAVHRDGVRLELDGSFSKQAWVPGTSLVLACPDGFNEYEVWVAGELKKVVATECGVPVPASPPFFQGRVVDGDADGRNDAVQLTLVAGGPVDLSELNATAGTQTLRIYATPLKSELARGTATNGTELYTPCLRGGDTLDLVWRQRALPGLSMATCEAFIPGVDAPHELSSIDVDGDGQQDGISITLGNATDGPFELEQIEAHWGNETAVLNASATLEAPPDIWLAGEDLVATCPTDGQRRFSLSVRGTLIVQTFTTCQRSPGQPLLDLELSSERNTLTAELVFSRLGDLDLQRVTANGEPVGNGTWQPGNEIVLDCPWGTLELLYDGRLAFRGQAPC